MAHRRGGILILIVSAVLLFSGLARTPVFIVDESRNASCAMEMMERGEWVVPYYNGKLREDKPPLHYYFMRLSYTVFGQNAFGARFFSVVFGWLCLLVVWLYCSRQMGQTAANWALLVLASSVHFMLEFHLAVPDPYLIFFMTLAFFSFHDYLRFGRSLEWWLLYVSLGLAVLSKGPVGLLLPGLVFLVYLLFQGKDFWHLLKNLKLLPGAFVFLVVAVPWYYLVWQATDGVWLEAFLFEHNLDRFSSAKEGHGASPFVVPLMVLAGMLPFSTWYPQAIYRWRKANRNSLAFFAILASLLVILFFSISGTKLPNYPMPAYPMMAVSVAWILTRNQKDAGIHYWLSAFLGLGLSVAAYLLLSADPIMAHLRWHGLVFLPIFIFGFVAILQKRKFNLKKARLILAGGWILMSFLLFAGSFPAVAKLNPATKAFGALNLSEAELVHFRGFNPAFSFSYKKEIPEYWDKWRLWQDAKSSQFDYVLSFKKHEEELSDLKNLELVFESPDVFEYTTTQIWRVVEQENAE